MAKVLFAFAHPDDETLCAGTAVVEHVIAGHDVHVASLTRGETSGALDMLNGALTSSWWGVPHVPAEEGYIELTALEFGQARIAELHTAMAAMATGIGTITVHDVNLATVTQTAARDAILALCDQIDPAGGAVRIKTHTNIVDNHPDHVAIGAAALQLRSEFPTRFSDLRMYLLSNYWTDPRLSQVSEAWDAPTDAAVAARVINAGRAYGAWAPEVDRYAIGYHSVPGLFAALAVNQKCMYYAP